MGHEQVLANGQVCHQTLHFASLKRPELKISHLEGIFILKLE